jgi:hypothetical protein
MVALVSVLDYIALSAPELARRTNPVGEARPVLASWEGARLAVARPVDAGIIQMFVEGSRYSRTGDLVWPQRSRKCIHRMLQRYMEHSSHTRSKWPEPAERCIDCGHLESEHGRTGTRPCLAMIGDLLDRHFCPCDELKTAAALGPARVGLTAA